MHHNQRNGRVYICIPEKTQFTVRLHNEQTMSLKRWIGKVAVVTGASSGIGAATAIALANEGMKVVGAARRVDRIEALKSQVKGSGELHSFQADVGCEEDITALFEFVKNKFGAIHVLINNAGIVRPGTLTDQEPRLIRETVGVNLLGLTFCTQHAIRLMKESNVDDGHIIHINSVCGHQIVNAGNGSFTSIYSATKYAVTASTEQLRQELVFAKSKIRITSISPGYVATEIIKAGLENTGGQFNTELQALVDGLPHLESEDIVGAVVYALSTPPHVQVHEITIKPIGETF